MRTIPLITLLLVGLALCGPARADEAPGFYLGVSVGQTQVDDVCDGVTSCDDTDTGFKIFGGYQFNQYFGVEGGYVDLGKASATGSGADPLLGTFSGTAELETWGAFASAVATIPIGQYFGIFGKVGGAYTDSEATLTGTSSTLGAGTVSASDEGFNLTYGVGAKINVSQGLSIRVEWERFQEVGGDFEVDVDLISAGISYKF
jgi:OOP family OmpA-OmpF porin